MRMDTIEEGYQRGGVPMGRVTNREGYQRGGLLTWLPCLVFNRPGVAGAVLQSPPSLIKVIN